MKKVILITLILSVVSGFTSLCFAKPNDIPRVYSISLNEALD